MIVKTEDKSCITLQIILSEKLYEQLIQNCMHLCYACQYYYFISKYIVARQGSDLVP